MRKRRGIWQGPYWKNDEKEKSTENLLDGPGLFMSGSWNGWGDFAHPADGSLLHGDGVLLRKEFPETA